MAERKRLGLIFTVNPNWMGGTNYILNLINSFNYLDDDKRPEVTLMCAEESDFKYALDYTNYPYLDYKIFYRRLNKFCRVINKISRAFFSKNFFSLYYKAKFKKLHVIYPIINRSLIVKGPINIGWIPDFQEKHLPEFFSEEELKYRHKQAKDLKDSGIKIMLSSEDAKKDYIRFYNASENNTAVFRFSANIPVVIDNPAPILSKYNVEKDKFFFCGNQFWIHKNHLALFNAVRILKDKGVQVRLLCTGNPNDYRTADYFNELSKYIKDNNLQDNINILGLIDRDEQLTLMKNSLCVIQPSLFEGWNTSVEEAKAMNKLLIVSDLDVHKEQISRNGLFFDRRSADDLAEKMNMVMKGELKIEYCDYTLSIKNSAESFIKIFENCLKSFRRDPEKKRR